MRDLAREAHNGVVAEGLRVALEDEPLRVAPAERAIPAEVRRDLWLSRMASMLVETASMLDPITRIVAARTLALLGLLAACGVSLYTIRPLDGWERVAAGVPFVILAAWALGRGMK